MYASDALLAVVISDPRLLAKFQNSNDLLFVAATALLLYWLINDLLTSAWLTTLAAPGEPARLLTGEDAAPHPPRIAYTPLLIFLLLAVAIGGTGYLVYAQQKNLWRQSWQAELQAVADAKGDQIAHWMAERRADADAVTGDPLLAEEVTRWFAEGAPADDRRERLRRRLRSIEDAYGYATVTLLDARGRPQLSAGQGWFDEDVYSLVNQALTGGRVVLSDLHPHEDDAGVRVVIDMVAPLGPEPAGAVYFRIDPATYLFPAIQAWPGPSPSAESLLVRRDGDHILYLNELRHRSNTAARLRLPLVDGPAPARAAVEGREGAVEGPDYRGVPVQAAVRSIPGTPWFLIAKVDTAEVYAHLRTIALLVAALVGVFITAAGLGIGLWWRHQHARFVTDHYRSELERQALMRHFDYLSKYANDIILLADPTGHLLEANERAVATYGYSRAELLERTLQDLHPPAARDQVRARIAQTGSSDGLLFEAVQQRRDGGTFPVEISARRIDVDGRQFLQAIIRDISARKQIEQQLRQVQKMEAVGHLTGGIAHDFNNLLAVILGNLELLQEGLGAEDGARDLAERATTAADRGANLVRRLLAFARQQPLQARPTEVNALVSGMLDLLRRTLGADIQVQATLAPDLWPTEIDPTQLESSLLNLALNARDAMPLGGRLSIETRNCQLDSHYAAQHQEVRAGPYVLLTVSDTGVGIPPEVLERVFEPFFTTKEVGQGTGLGLSMVYGFVKQSGGHISIYSEPGQGTTVKLYLPPRAGADATGAGVVTPVETLPMGRGETILVVEDQAEVRRLVVHTLQGLGYHTLEAADAAAALQILEQTSAVALLFTDVVLPGGMSGIELARQVRERYPACQTLLTSGHPEKALGPGDPAGLPGGWMAKPYRKALLAQRVRALLAERRAQDRTAD